MLAARYRLNLTKEFPKLKKHGTVVHQPPYTALYRKNQEGVVKVGFVVSKKVGKAVERNRAKRVLSEVVRSVLDKLPGVDLVLIAKNRIKEANYEEISHSFDQVLSKILKP